MSTRELVVLGTASQVPTRHRNHNGYLLLWDGIGVLFDPGEGTQRQMVRAGVSASQIHHICITHFHGDHCLGLAGIIQRISLDEVPHEVSVHYPASGQQYFDRMRRASIFLDRSKLRPRPVRDDGLLVDGPLRIHARHLQHTVPCIGFRCEEPDGVTMLPEELSKRGVKGRAIRDLMNNGQIVVGDTTVRLEEVSMSRPGQAFAMVMDTKRCAAAVELARGADLLLAESTYLSAQQREATQRGHMTAADAARVAREGGARKLVLSHFSQRYPRLEPFVEEARAIHRDVVAVRDGDRVPVPQRNRSPVG